MLFWEGVRGAVWWEKEASASKAWEIELQLHWLCLCISFKRKPSRGTGY